MQCNICCNVYHQQCSGLSKDVLTVLLGIISQSGWVCQKCRLNYTGLKTELAKVNEELADMRTSMAWLFEELNTLKKACTKPDGAGGGGGALLTSANANCPGAASLINLSDVQRVVSRTIGDVSKRKYNVVVTSLPESENGGPEEDAKMFTKFCEENLSVKPVLAHRECHKLGKRTDQRPRKILIYLRSESSAISLLCASRNLRRYEATRVFLY